MPERSSPSSPSIPPPLTAFSFAPLPWRTVRWQGAFRSTHNRGTACYIGGTVGGGGFPPPKLPRVPRHAGAENGPASPYSLPLVPGLPQPVRSAGLPWTGSPCGTSAVLPPWPWLSNSISTLPLAHVVSSCTLPPIHTPSTPCTPCTAPVPSADPVRKVPLPSSATHTPPQTGSPPPGMGGRPC